MREIDANERIRQLCGEIVDEQDPERVDELLATLRSTLRSENEEVRLRMKLVARHYRGRIQATASPDGEAINQGGGRMRAVLDFLGLGAGMRLGGELEG